MDPPVREDDPILRLRRQGGKAHAFAMMLAMPSLTCPHCGGRVIANPLGRWHAKFTCPHCRKALRFNGNTNFLGVLGSAFFIAGGVCFIMARPPYDTYLVAGAAVAWVVLTGLSYALRGIEKG